MQHHTFNYQQYWKSRTTAFSGSQGFEEDEADAECREAGALVPAMENHANQLKSDETDDVKVHCRASRRTRRTRSAGRRWRCSFSWWLFFWSFDSCSSAMCNAQGFEEDEADAECREAEALALAMQEAAITDVKSFTKASSRAAVAATAAATAVAVTKVPAEGFWQLVFSQHLVALCGIVCEHTALQRSVDAAGTVFIWPSHIRLTFRCCMAHIEMRWSRTRHQGVKEGDQESELLRHLCFCLAAGRSGTGSSQSGEAGAWLPHWQRDN